MTYSQWLWQMINKTNQEKGLLKKREMVYKAFGSEIFLLLSHDYSNNEKNQTTQISQTNQINQINQRTLTPESPTLMLMEDLERSTQEK